MSSPAVPPKDNAISAASSVITIKAAMMMAMSMKKAVERSLISASLRRRSMPSGVIKRRWRSGSSGTATWPDAAAGAGVLSVVLIFMVPRQIEIERPQQNREHRDGVTQARIRDQLSRD